MTSQGVAANSRLAEMQLKFQKKQMLEREQKKLSLIGADYSHTSKSEIGNGKVRQMFDDRRRGVGIDRSHPLRPIATSTASTFLTAAGTTQQPTTNKRLMGKANTSSIKTTPSTRLKCNTSVSNGNINIFQNNLDELDNIDNETFPKEFSSLSLSNAHIVRSRGTNDGDFENNNSKESSFLGDTIIINRKTGPKTNGIKLNPVITKKSPTTAAVPRTTIRTPNSSSSRASTLSKSTPKPQKSPPTKVVLLSKAANQSNKAGNNKMSNAKPATFVLAVKPPPRISTPPPGMASCQHCQRHFSEDRLDKHEEVCGKMMSKKRKIFDASKHRVKGTEAEKYLKKGNNNLSNPVPKLLVPSHSTAQAAKISKEKKSNWRKKHEEFIAAIREAKKVQTHLAKGGKLSDLPPPPPSENPDYIQCPHCSRRFNESAAERHIPKCANMRHNKPKPIQRRS